MSTGTSGFAPTYPTIPHISGPGFLGFGLLLAKFRGPAWFVLLTAARNRHGVRRHVLRNRRTGSHVSALANHDGRDELRVAADKHAVFDDRLMLLHAVVIARDGAGADVHVRADRRVAQIREMVRLRSGS